MSPFQKYAFWSLLAAGFLLRVLFLDRASYHIDEVNVIQFALQEKGYFTAYDTELDRFLFMHRLPLLMIILKVALSWFPSAEGVFPSEWVTRLPFALFGALTLPLFFWVGRLLGGVRLGLWVLFLAALNPFHVYYSREAYDYSMVVFFGVSVIGCALEFWQRHDRRESRTWLFAVAYVVAAIGLLHSHLSGLLFLTTWSAILGIALLRQYGWKGLFDARKAMVWLPVLGVPYFVFLPFIFKLLGGGWVNQENPLANTVPSFVALLGRMGWGEAIWALVPFSLVLLVGVAGIRKAEQPSRRLMILIAVRTVAYLALQSWLLRVSRFEVRYYSPLMPCLAIVAAVGMHYLWTTLHTRLSPRLASACAAIVVVLLGCWMGYNAGLVSRLEARGANYKGVAKWIVKNIPENGIYSYWNIYDARAVPVVYPTPGKFLSYPAAWSTAEDYRNLKIRERLTSFFTRFPTAYFVETAPADLIAPERANVHAIARSELFRNRIWLSDPVYQRMVKLKTLPQGEAQWDSPVADKYHISFNRPEDMTDLARQQGRTVFHYFGFDWSYVKDQQMNDWMGTAQSATLFVGNIAEQPQSIRVAIKGMAPPSGCLLNVYLPNGVKLVDSLQISPSMQDFSFDIPNLAPGVINLTVDVLPNPTSMSAQFFAYSAEAQPIR